MNAKPLLFLPDFASCLFNAVSLNLRRRHISLLAAALLIIATKGNAQTFTLLKSLSVTNGGGSTGGLTLTNGILYGAGGGGNSNAGIVFGIGTNGAGFSVIHHFAGGSEGEFPIGRVVVSGNTIYGMTYRGGTNDGFGDGGIIYRVNTDGSGYSVLRRLNRAMNDGVKPSSGMVLSGGNLYGTTTGGGVNDRGTVFKISTNGSGYENLHSFSGGNDGEQPECELILIGNTLFGTTAFSQFATSSGVLFKINTDGTGFTNLYTFPVTFSLLAGYLETSRLTPVGDVFYGEGSSYENNEILPSIYKIGTNGDGSQIVAQLPPTYGIRGPLTWTGHELLAVAVQDLSSGSFDQIFQIRTNGTGYFALKTFGASGTTDPNQPLGDFALNGTTIYGGSSGGEFNYATIFSFDTRPRLTISGDTAMKISWPSYAQDYQLEQSPTLATSSWTNVAASPVDDGTNRMITLPAPTTSNPMFHRLRR